MLFGDLIAQLSDESAAEETLLQLFNLALLAQFRAQAEANGLISATMRRPQSTKFESPRQVLRQPFISVGIE